MREWRSAVDMGKVSNRLRKGAPTWLDQLTFRFAGLALLGGFVWGMCLGCAANQADLTMANQTRIWFIAIAVVISLISGLCLTFVGPALLRHVDIPQRRAMWMERDQLEQIADTALSKTTSPLSKPYPEVAETFAARMISWLVGGSVQPRPANSNRSNAHPTRATRS